ncbi:riboflavin synthase [Salinisphaera japonica]|uniref:Riboflavin synthase n=1 Tax=Salinisphaera japonica YTM-1 TaxID=1209778 RepID=A0A423PJ29_9GAMM|nr:riboflavin synthase [Salinisphaera japonica]ROO25598.1 riboflavin synthase subunit alpha [Salinisphaera japonica YTM-1]
MFTGLIQGVGQVVEQEKRGGDTRLVIDCGDADLGTIAVGDSIAISGVCLTATEIDGHCFAADVSKETLKLTTLGNFVVGTRVNLEPPLRAGDALGGHMVAGHVDGLGVVEELHADARSWRLSFSVPKPLARYLASKGSIAVDGISLTINEVDDRRFGVNIIPHTMSHTSLGDRRIGDHVNIEVDLVARYLARIAGYE